MTKKPKLYVNNDGLLREIAASKKRLRESNVELTVAESLTRGLIDMLSMMIEKYSSRRNWRNYTYLEEMKAEARAVLCANALKFDETRYFNPFAYYTQIIKRSFISYLDKEEKVRDIRDNILEAAGMMPSFARQSDNETKSGFVNESRAENRNRLSEINRSMGRMEDYDRIIPQLSKLKDPNKSLDRSIGKVLGIGQASYTNFMKDALKCLPDGYAHRVEQNVQIGDQKGTLVSVYEKAGTTSNKRLLLDPERHHIPIAVVFLSLTIRRNMLVKRMQDLNGDKSNGMNMPFVPSPGGSASPREDTTSGE